MSNKEKGLATTMPMRGLDEKGIPYHTHQQAHLRQVRRDAVFVTLPASMVAGSVTNSSNSIVSST